VDRRASISTDMLARDAADAACEVEGAGRVADGHLPRQRGVRLDDGGAVALELVDAPA
jgi:hypothetical protein